MSESLTFNEDCMAVMARYPDKYFDLAVVDPPYGIGVDGQAERYDFKNPKHSRKGHAQKDWDKSIPPKEYFDQLFRVSKNQIIWGRIILLSICERVIKVGLFGIKVNTI